MHLYEFNFKIQGSVTNSVTYMNVTYVKDRNNDHYLLLNGLIIIINQLRGSQHIPQNMNTIIFQVCFLSFADPCSFLLVVYVYVYVFDTGKCMTAYMHMILTTMIHAMN